MMKYYIDIVMKEPDYKIMGIIYSKLHFTLYDMRSNKIGVSFPNATNKAIGTHMRLQSESKAELERLQETGFTKLIERYCTVTPILDVPKGVKYIMVKKAKNTRSHSHIRRLIRRGANPEDLKPALYGTRPHLRVYSVSTGGYTTRDFKFTEAVSEYKSGEFNTFGLSKGGMVAAF